MSTPHATDAAFEITKGEFRVPFLSEADVERHLDLRQLLDGLESGFARLQMGQVQSPPRPEITVPGHGFSLAMMAWQPGMQICVKVVNVFEANLDRALPNHLALIALFDPETGATTCILDGTYITGIRTAATAVLSARLLSRTDAKVATIVGAGVQAREHLRLLPLVRDLDKINICSLYPEHAERLAHRSSLAYMHDDVEEAVRESDIVCLATHSPTPVLSAEWVRPGTHVSSVGYCPPHGELPPTLAEEGRLFVEHPDAFLPSPVGCAELVGIGPAHATMLGAVAVDASKGRRSDEEITVYKAMGIGMEDMIAANLVFDSARSVGDADIQAVTW
jgi:ornithine cyclodeaminase/alanine dehydrogenase-like protein (mu-crystallin family)